MGDKEVAKKLTEAGNKLLKLPTQVDVLLPLLDQVESLLSKVEQSPSEPIQKAYAPSMKALLKEPLLRHSDVDVRVAIASCISEITRITAPEAPYNDDQMKDVFQLIVSSFENLSDTSSRSYIKRASILETVAKVRSCVVMLDLECDGLIAEMFKHFLNSIRDYHPESVFTSMETIMTLVLEESEDVSVELLTPILASLNTDNEEIPTISRKLGERVFEKCAVKIKPYLTQAVKSLGVSLDKYSKVVAAISEGTNGEVGHDDNNVSGGQLGEDSNLASSDEAAKADENKLNTASSDETAHDAKELVAEEAHFEEVHPEAQISLKSVSSNGTTETANKETQVISESSNKPDEGNFISEPLDVNLINKVDTDDSDAGKLDKSESNLEQSCQKTSDKEAEKSPDLQKSDSKTTHTSSAEDQNVDTGASSEKENELSAQISSPKPFDSEVVNIASLSPSDSLLDESLLKKAGHPKMKDNLSQEDALSVDPFPEKVADGASDPEVQPVKHSEKKDLNLAQEDAPSVDPVSAKADDATSDLEDKQPRGSGKEEETLAEEDAPFVDPVSANVRDGTSDLEVKPQRHSGKKKVKLAQDVPSVGPVSAKVPDETDDSEGKAKRRSGKKKVNLAQEDAPSVDPVLAKIADGSSDSEVKPQRQSGKKASARITKEEKMLAGGGTSKNEGENTSDSEAKPLQQSANKGDASDLETKTLKQSGKKGETSGLRGKPLKQFGKKGDSSDSETKPSTKKEDRSNNEDKVSLKRDDGNRRGRGKDTREKDLSKAHANDNDQDMDFSPKSTSKSVKGEDGLEDPKTNSKRKRTPSKDKVSGNIEYGANLVGSKIKVWWPKDREFYEGVIESFDPNKKKHKVSYTDGDEEILALQKERWEFVEDGTMQEDANEDLNPDSSAKTHKRKKAKTNSEPLPKQKPINASPKSKSKGAATKSGSKIDDGKIDSKSKDKTSKATGKSEAVLKRSDDGKSVGDVSRAASKSKDDDGRTPKITTKSKQVTPKTVTKTKGKAPQSSSKSNGTGKVKSSSSKVKETEDTTGRSPNSSKTPDTVKGKSPDISKVRESGGKSGKKRRRGFKG